MTAIDLMEKEMRFAQPSVSALVFVNVFCMYIPDAYCWVLSFNPKMDINGLFFLLVFVSSLFHLPNVYRWVCIPELTAQCASIVGIFMQNLLMSRNA